MYCGLHDLYRMMRMLRLTPRVPPWAQPMRKGKPLHYNSPWLPPRPHRNRARDKLRQCDKPKQ